MAFASGRSDTMKTRATYEDLLAVPDDKVAEILDGELFVSPRPAVPHARTSSVLGNEIGGPFDRGRGGPGGWWVLDEPELHLGDDVLVPDLAAWRRERLPTLPKAAFFTLAPDWVCDVVSPSTEQIDRRRKQPIYAREGVSHLWLLAATHAGAERARAEPFEALELELAALWI